MELKLSKKVFGDLQYDLYPRMVRIRQKFNCPEIDDIQAGIKKEMEKEEIISTIKPGAEIAVLVGSRGIANISEIVGNVIRLLKLKGAHPFIVPAMASHGGATEEGQRELLSSLGITEESMGVYIRTNMEPELIGVSKSGVNIYFDVEALNADGVIPINRIKAHTAFRGRTESGLMKMLAIGAGKQKGAESLHSHGADTFAELLPEAFDIIRGRVNVLFGVAIIENAREKTAMIEMIPVEEIYQREEGLLKIANEYMPQIMIEKFDGLIVGKTGKNISGDGMDPNIMGRFAVPNMKGGPDYQRMALLDVTEESHGNAVGIGLADVIPRKLLEKANLDFMYMNAFTSKMVIPIVKIPMIADNDQEAIGVMLRTCVRVEKGKERVIYIKNTLDLEEIWVSEEVLRDISNVEGVEVVGELQDMQFDSEGNLINMG